MGVPLEVNVNTVIDNGYATLYQDENTHADL